MGDQLAHKTFATPVVSGPASSAVNGYFHVPRIGDVDGDLHGHWTPIIEGWT